MEFAASVRLFAFQLLHTPGVSVRLKRPSGPLWIISAARLLARLPGRTFCYTV